MKQSAQCCPDWTAGRKDKNYLVLSVKKGNIYHKKVFYEMVQIMSASNTDSCRGLSYDRWIFLLLEM